MAHGDCNDCKHFEPLPEESKLVPDHSIRGRCCRNPPERTGPERESYDYPLVEPPYHCGEWKSA
jgi:hypothetical protein